MDLIAGLGEYRRGGLAPRDWYRSVRRIDESGWFSTDDLGPTGVFAARLATRIASRARRRVWKREPSPTITMPRQRSPRFYPGRLDSRRSVGEVTPPQGTTPAA